MVKYLNFVKETSYLSLLAGKSSYITVSLYQVTTDMVVEAHKTHSPDIVFMEWYRVFLRVSLHSLKLQENMLL